jgi:hypothetical protein
VSGAAIRAFVAACVVLALPAVPAAAQQPAGRFTVSFGAGVQAALPAFNDRFDFLRPVDQAEEATAVADYRGKAALLIDGGFAVRLKGNIGVGVSISRFKGEGSAGVTAQMPHPFLLDTFREVSGNASSLDNTELGYHLQLQYSRPLSRRLRLVVSAGPTFFDVKRDLVTAVQIDEAYPFDTATFRSATASVAKGSGIGFNAGADVAWTFNRSAGLGAMVRYARGSVDPDVAARSVRVDAEACR